MPAEAMSPEQARAVLAEAEYDPAKGTRHYPDEQRAVVKAALMRLDLERRENAAAEHAREERERLQRMVAASKAQPTPKPSKPSPGAE